jgi:hypothetical protein
VYVSSTYLDLGPERAAVEGVLNTLKDTKFIGMEYFGSREDTTRGASLKAMDQSDLYVGILGGRYGSGITEAEYDHARARQIPCHIYLKRNPVPDPADAEKLRLFKDNVRNPAKGHLVSEFSSADDLAKHVVADLHNWLFDRYVVPAMMGAFGSSALDDRLQAIRDEVAELAAFNRGLWARIVRTDVVQRWMPTPPGAISEWDVVLPTRVREAIAGEFPELKEHVYSEFGDLVAQLTQSFVGRESIFAAIREFTRRHASGYFQIVGAAGLGKTALAAEIARRFDAPVFFASISSGRTHAAEFLRHICAELVLERGLAVSRLPPRAGADSSFLLELLRKVQKSRENPLWLVVDALDEADEPQPGQNPLLLPSDLPEHVYLAVTRRDEARLVVNPPTAIELVFLASSAEEQRRDIRNYLERQVGQPFLQRVLNAATPPIDTATFVSALSDASQGNFKYIEYVVKDIAAQQPGDPFLDLSALPEGLSGYYAQFWSSMHSLRDSRGWNEWTGLYLPVIALLAIAGEPVSAEWLALLIGRDAAEIRESVLPRYRRFLESTARRDIKLWSVVHRSFTDYLRNEALVDLKPYHDLIASKFQPTECWDIFDRYALRHLARHLRESGQHERLFALIDDSAWYAKHIASDSTGSTFLGDLAMTWELAENLDEAATGANQSASAIAREFACGAVSATFNTVAANLPPALTAALVRLGKWTIDQAVQSAARGSDRVNYVKVLAAVAQVPLVSSARCREVLHQALEVARALKEPERKAEALVALALHLDPDERVVALTAALAGIQSMSRPPDAAELYRTIVPLITAEPLLYPAAMAAGLQLIEQGYDVPLVEEPDPATSRRIARRVSQSIGAKIARMPRLAPSQRHDATERLLEHAEHYPYEAPEIYAGLIQTLAGNERRQILERLHAISCPEQAPFELPGILKAVLPLLDEAERGEVISSTVAAFSGSAGDDMRALIFAPLIPYLRGPQRLEILRTALANVEALRDPEARAQMLDRHYLELADGDTSGVLLESIERMELGTSKSRFLSALLPHLPDPLAGRVIDDALSANLAIRDDSQRIRFLSALALRIPAGSKSRIVDPALANARRIEYPEDKAKALTLLIPTIEDLKRHPVVLEALATAQAIEWSLARIVVILALLEWLDPAAQQEAIGRVLNELENGGVVGDARFQEAVLPKLVPLVGSDPVRSRRVWAAIGQIDSALSQILLRATLLPYMDEAAGTEAEQELLKQTRNMREQWERGRALSTLAFYLDPARQPDFIREAFTTVRGLAEDRRSMAIYFLVPALARWLSAYPDCWKDAYAAANSLTRTGERSWAVTQLIASLPENERPRVICEAKSAAEAEKEPFWRAAAFCRLIQYLEGDNQAAAFDQAVLAARASDPVTRATYLARLAGHAPAPRILVFLKESLASVREVEDGGVVVPSYRFEPLQRLAPLVVTDPTLLDDCVDQVLELEREEERTALLSDLVQHVSGCGPDTHYRLWRRSYRRLASRGRDNLLTDAIPLLPLIERLAGTQAATEVGEAVIRYVERWP